MIRRPIPDQVRTATEWGRWAERLAYALGWDDAEVRAVPWSIWSEGNHRVRAPATEAAAAEALAPLAGRHLRSIELRIPGASVRIERRMRWLDLTPLPPRLVARVDALRAERCIEMSAGVSPAGPADRPERRDRRLANAATLTTAGLLAVFAAAALAGGETVAYAAGAACLAPAGLALWLIHGLDTHTLRRGAGLGVKDSDQGP